MDMNQPYAAPPWVPLLGQLAALLLLVASAGNLGFQLPLPSWVLLVNLALLTRVARPSSRDIAEGDPERPLVPVSDDID
jgi:hypothetical protein